MLDSIIAKTQVGLSYLILIAYFGLIAARGLGYITIDIDLNELVMMVAMFWFMRSRTSGVPNANP